MRGFTLLELLIVLVIISLSLALAFPAFYKASLKGEAGFENRFSSLVEGSFAFGAPVELCVDFEGGAVEVGRSKVELPYPAESLVLPGRVVSSKRSTRFCFEPRGVTAYAINFKKDGGYLTVLVLYPTGEVLYLELNEAQEETLKDKLLKGRIAEWFSYYSF